MDAPPRRHVACFDLDGTLLDPNGSIRAAIDAAVDWGGYGRFAEHEVLIGMPLRDILRLRTGDEEQIEAMVDRFRQVYLDDSWRLARWIPGVLDVVRELRDDGIHTAVVTTKGEEEAVQLLAMLDVADLFDTVVGDDGIRPLKPHPAPVIAACARLDRQPEDACMVGDTLYDVGAGAKAGAFTIGVLWGHGSHDELGAAGADVVVRDVAGLRDALAAWRGKAD